MICKICGKEFDVLYPTLWRYKRGAPEHVEAWLCSWSCLREYDKRKEAKKMGRTRKDGTPAKKPERKQKEEKPKVILQYDESIREEYRKEQEAMAAAVEQPQPETEWIPAAMKDLKPVNIINGEEAGDVQVTGIRTKAGEFRFDRHFRTIDWRHDDLGEEISMPPEDWKQLAEDIGRALRLLGAD